jgi:K+ transporter
MARAIPLEEFMATVEAARSHSLRCNKVLHKRLVELTVATALIPYITDEERLSIQPLGHDIFNVPCSVRVHRGAERARRTEQACQ